MLRGNAIVGQSGGPTAAINATLAGVIRGALDEISVGGAICRLYGMKNGVDGLLREDIVELDKLAGEPVDIHVNGKFLAKGEVVVIDENFGVRITDIVSPEERAAKLQ